MNEAHAVVSLVIAQEDRANMTGGGFSIELYLHLKHMDFPYVTSGNEKGTSTSTDPLHPSTTRLIEKLTFGCRLMD